MPTRYSGTILFQQDQQKALVSLSYAPSFEAVQTFAAALHTLTTADIVDCSFTQAVDPELIGPGGEFEDTSFGAQFHFRHTNPMADVPTRDFRLPAPQLSIFEHIPGRGYRIKQAHGEFVATAFSALMEEAYEFESGWLVH
jgi:hypothetical protein